MDLPPGERMQPVPGSGLLKMVPTHLPPTSQLPNKVATGFPTKVQIFTLTKESTIDKPKYRLSTAHDITLQSHDLNGIGSIRNAIISRTGAGFLGSQFFRIAFEQDFQRGVFMTSNVQIQQSFQRYQHIKPWSIYVIRYTKLQTSLLKNKVTKDEFQYLNNVITSKRKYTRQPLNPLPVDLLSIPPIQEPVISGARTSLTQLQLRRYLDHAISAPFYSERALERWGQLVRNGQWESLVVPPPELPIVDRDSWRGTRGITVPRKVYPYCCLFLARMLSQETHELDLPTPPALPHLPKLAGPNMAQGMGGDMSMLPR
eukprot:gnl/Dysnectes_brevis/1528_a1735_1705.p1 GENE.gnl/Dysnectes_brevis/1528_a1735_1705~~gnl/Dysnectes_brevis/1528_a1735_1705.p1  ORF type:complete len:315 (+),score=64.11 gnl/Dysnectes_brevis/1528_a1735_1705:1294-2238(+)